MNFARTSYWKGFLLSISLLVSYYSTSQAQRLSSERILLPVEQEEALDVVLNKTLVSSYAAYVNNFSSSLMIEDEPAVVEMRTFVSTPSTHYEFMFALNAMLAMLFQDAHYRVELSSDDTIGNDYLSLDLCLEWIPTTDSNEPWDLVSTCETLYAGVGDAVLSIGDLSPLEIFDKLKVVIPHENDYFIAALPPSWLVREDFLLFLGVVNANDATNSTITVSVTLERSVGISTISIPLAAPAARNDDDEPFVSFDIFDELSTAVFTLNDCTYNEEYVSNLTEFWTKVQDRGVDQVVLDLRNNRGGDFSVAPAFVSYLTANSYSIFDIEQRNSEDLCLQIPQLCDPALVGALVGLGIPEVTGEFYSVPGDILAFFLVAPVAQTPDTLFEGDVYVLTSGVTFSSAHLFAAVMQQNDFGTLIGTPTGNSPSFWGNVIQFPLPHTDLTLFLTTGKTQLTLESQDAIVPDIFVPTTRSDIAEGRDAQLQYVLDMAVPSSSSPSASPSADDRTTEEPTAMQPSTAPSSSGAGRVNIVCSFETILLLAPLLLLLSVI